MPSIIFKERNINISLNLIDKNNQKVLNCKLFPIQLTSCTSASEFVMRMVTGSIKTRLDKTSWREKRRSKCTMDRVHSWRCTLVMWVATTPMERCTLWFIPNPLCLNLTAARMLLKKALIAPKLSHYWSATSRSRLKRVDWSYWFIFILLYQHLQEEGLWKVNKYSNFIKYK
jgi:hypothetical protein